MAADQEHTYISLSTVNPASRKQTAAVGSILYAVKLWSRI
jgi:hypothetical protein